MMEPGTDFTKIWRLKNVGEVPWPAGAKMLFVGGDQMTTEMSVPLSRSGAVMPGEEVDVAVEMVAPAELGRYLGYWRLVGPHGRRKFGQRVWCHVQVVDPSMEAVSPPTDADLATTLAEIEKKKSEAVANDNEADDDTTTDDIQPTTAAVAAAGGSSSAASSASSSSSSGSAAAASAAASAAAAAGPPDVTDP